MVIQNPLASIYLLTRRMALLVGLSFLLRVGAAATTDDLCPLTFYQNEGAELVAQFTVEIAQTPTARERGLMDRSALASGSGMLFDFGTERTVTMWMKNTLIPLDMVFISAAGQIEHIERRTTPLSESRISSAAPVRYVLEVAAGDATPLREGAAGARLDLAPIRSCVEKLSSPD